MSYVGRDARITIIVSCVASTWVTYVRRNILDPIEHRQTTCVMIGRNIWHTTRNRNITDIARLKGKTTHVLQAEIIAIQ
jgi:hypothetical protein